MIPVNQNRAHLNDQGPPCLPEKSAIWRELSFKNGVPDLRIPYGGFGTFPLAALGAEEGPKAWASSGGSQRGSYPEPLCNPFQAWRARFDDFLIRGLLRFFRFLGSRNSRPVR